MKEKQNGRDIRIVVVGGLIPILLLMVFGLYTGLGLSVLFHWGLATRMAFSRMESRPTDVEILIHRGEIV